ncbi:hypothetical protein DFS34DRAFT_578158 [Phlyctochytrium arcticum]|nr:hypothetical protein DFS34DRAFT_578158 [Phlyctochytrium arcticum]
MPSAVKPLKSFSALAATAPRGSEGKGDGLLITARGLGLRSVLLTFLQVYCDPRGLVLLINTPAKEFETLKEDLVSLRAANGPASAEDDESHPDLFRIINNETPASERADLYRSGGVLSITSRILVVDMLNKLVPFDLLLGVIVNHAHRITDTSTEAFILRLFRDDNKVRFIKAISEEPEAFTHGFWKLERSMKLLFLRHVYFWPRFHVRIQETLDTSGGVKVLETQVSYTKTMQEIQAGLVDCIDQCLAELRRSNPSIDAEDFVVENAFFKSFDQTIKAQLDPIWHRIGSKSKQLVSDMKILRRLLSYLVSYDCITFNSFLETIVAANAIEPSAVFRSDAAHSQWLLLDAAQVVLEASRRRVYMREPGVPGDLLAGIPPGVRPVMEEQPKWGALVRTLKAIQADRHKRLQAVCGPTLVMVEGDRTCAQLREIVAQCDLTLIKPETEVSDESNQDGELGADQETPARNAYCSEGSERLLNRLLAKYFRWKSGMSTLTKNLYASRKERQLAEQLAKGKGTLGRGDASARGAPANKRRRVRGGSSVQERGQYGQEKSGSRLSATFEKEAEEIANFIVIRPYSSTSMSLGGDSSANGDDDTRVLNDLRPSYIVMYDSDLGFIRRVEIFKALNASHHLEVHFLVYSSSVEEQRFLAQIRKEKAAFEKLIREKSIMAVPIDQDGRTAVDPDEEFWKKIDTRLAGGQRIPASEKNQVIVDVREFRSSLPSLIHGRGITLKACTLEVGDYILSPDICVERKSVSDLISSLKSGRLYTQCDAMSLHYKIPVLLIEFDKDKAFSLHSDRDLKGEIDSKDVGSRLTLLCLHFPKLRLVWSSSAGATAEIVEDLKKNQEEPNMEDAMAVGVDNVESIDSSFNITPSDVLRSLPGINSKNYRHVMLKVDNLLQLSELTLKECQDILGQENGRMLHRFFRQNPKNDNLE